MEDKFPMNLQFFAENPAAGADDASDTGAPDEAENTKQVDGSSDNGQTKTFTQEEVDKMVEKRMARYDRAHQKEVESAKTEATKLAKMNKDQKKDYELQQAQQKAQDAEAQLARYQLRDTVRKQLVDGGFTPEESDIDLVVTADAETTKQNGDALLEMVERIRNDERQKTLSGSTPKVSGTQVKAPDAHEFMKYSYDQRVKLKHDNPTLYSQLVQQTL